MIRAVRCDQPSFRTITFQPGLNIVLAERTKESTKKDSRNGLGKTTLIEIIHFCLGSAVTNGLRRPKETPFDLILRAFVFVLVVLLFLSVLLGLLALLAAVAAASAENITLEGSGFYINLTVDTYWDAIIFLALPALIFFIAFVASFRLLLKAWRRRHLPRGV